MQINNRASILRYSRAWLNGRNTSPERTLRRAGTTTSWTSPAHRLGVS